MGKLTIDEVIGHCERTTERFEKQTSRVILENMPLREPFMKEYWEHRQVAEWLKELQSFKEKQEQGLLISLPCPVGTVIYIVNRYWHSVELGNICGFAECDDVDCFCYKVYVDPDTYENIAIADFGVDWFLTEAEAEEALAKMGGKE